jgi:ankyrin repeat protein
VEFLLNKGASVKMETKDGLTPLTQAAFNGSDEIVRLLLEHGANVNKSRGDGCTSLELAEAMSRNSTVELLLEAGTQRVAQPLGQAEHRDNSPPLTSNVRLRLEIP